MSLYETTDTLTLNLKMLSEPLLKTKSKKIQMKEDILCLEFFFYEHKTKIKTIKELMLCVFKILILRIIT